jgi:hypothetical protein
MKSKISVIAMEKKPALCKSRSLLLTRCYRTRTTADKRLRYASPKLPSATSFILETLAELLLGAVIRKYQKIKINLQI